MPQYQMVCLWWRILASRHCSFWGGGGYHINGTHGTEHSCTSYWMSPVSHFCDLPVVFHIQSASYLLL